MHLKKERIQFHFLQGKVKFRFNRLASQNYKSIKHALQKIILELLKRSIVKQKILHLLRLFYFLKLLKLGFCYVYYQDSIRSKYLYTTLSLKVKFQIIYCHKKFETITTRRKILRGFRICQYFFKI